MLTVSYNKPLLEHDSVSYFTYYDYLLDATYVAQGPG
jgi:hypothetical protein